jgi:hypothetical protein
MEHSLFTKSMALLVGLFLLAVAAGADPLPFEPGEKLHYEVRWEKVPVARVNFEVRSAGQFQGAPALQFIFQAKTYPALDVLFPVDGYIQAYTDPGMTRCLRLEKDMQEGWKRRAFRTDYDWERGMANYSKRQRVRRRVPLEDGTLDMLSVLYFARSLPLAPGLEVTRPVSSGKKAYQIKARVLRKETIVVNGRTWPAFLIEPDVRKAGGVFKKSKAPSVFLWISADERRIPLKLVSKVWVGAFFVELTDPPTNVTKGS